MIFVISLKESRQRYDTDINIHSKIAWIFLTLIFSSTRRKPKCTRIMAKVWCVGNIQAVCGSNHYTYYKDVELQGCRL
jgi:hypothetical protein